MTGNPDSDNRTVGLNLILIGSGHPDIRRRLNDGRGLRYHDRRGLSDHDRRGSHNYRSGIGHNHRARSNRIVDRAADKTTDDTADKSATVMMPVVVMVMMPYRSGAVTSGAGPAVRTGETCSGAESDRKHQRYCLELVHILPFPFSAFWRYIRLGNAH
jgi:hypothetical protein